MLKIGDFSKLSRVSVRMLRYYDENDILKPEKIDDFTGYRYYGEKQLRTIAQIVELREMGFGVAAIKEILKNGSDRENIEKLFAVQKMQLAEEAAEMQRRMQRLDTALMKLRKDEIMKYNCVIKTLEERNVASVRGILPSYDEEGRLWHILFAEGKVGGSVFGPGYAIFHDKEYKEADVDVEIQMEVKGTHKDTENVKFITMPEVEVVSVIFNGAYSQFNDVYATIAEWVEENGYIMNGPMMDLYHVSPNETRNPDEFVTEVCCPVCSKNAEDVLVSCN